MTTSQSNFLQVSTVLFQTKKQGNDGLRVVSGKCFAQIHLYLLSIPFENSHCTKAVISWLR